MSSTNNSNNLTRDEARQRADLLSDIRYDISLDLTQGSDTFGCEADISFACREPGASTFVDLLAPSVQRISLNGDELALSSHTGSRIPLPNLASRNELRIAATCAYENIGAGLSQFRDPVDDRIYLHSQSETFDAHRIYPCFDQPDLKASFDISVVAPEDWVVVSNTRPQGRRPKGGAPGSTIWSFPTTPLMPTYITAIVAGPFHSAHDRHGDIDLGVYCRQSLAQYLDPEEIFDLTRQGLDFYEEIFGYPYAFGKYDQLFVPEFAAGAMENAGCVTFHETFVFRSKVTEAARERRAEVILHEMAHMWFGDLVTMRWWDDLWLNESFATFMAHLSLVEATRFTNGWATFANRVKASARRQDQQPTTHPISANVPDIDSVRLNFDAITYDKGASVLRQLAAWVGDDGFRRGLATYVRRHQFSNAELTDYLRALEEGSGRDLATWSKEWLESAGLNTLRPEVVVDQADERRIASCAILQEAPPEWPTLRSHRLGIGLYDMAGGTLTCRRRVELDVSGPRTEIDELAGEQLPDLLLLNEGDLAYAKVRLDPRSLATVTDHLGDLDDLLSRALCWSSAWDMVRDALLPAGKYLDVFLRNAGAETDISTIQSLLDQAGAAVHVYGHPIHAPGRRRSLARFARRSLEEAEPGSDLQLVWARSFISAAVDQEDLETVRGLLDGTVAYQGLLVDTDVRWAIVIALSSAGVAEEELITRELERDPTDAGHRYAASGRAAWPTPQAKADAWSRAVDDASLPLATLRAVMGGFQRADQAGLLAPYAPLYFAALEQIWKTRDVEVALVMTRGLFPHVVIDESTLAMTQEHLEREGLPGPMRRILLESHDAMRRAISARAHDRATG
jgi:aminopeptidase N